MSLFPISSTMSDALGRLRKFPGYAGDDADSYEQNGGAAGEDQRAPSYESATGGTYTAPVDDEMDRTRPIAGVTGRSPVESHLNDLYSQGQPEKAHLPMWKQVMGRMAGGVLGAGATRAFVTDPENRPIVDYNKDLASTRAQVQEQRAQEGEDTNRRAQDLSNRENELRIRGLERTENAPPPAAPTPDIAGQIAAATQQAVKEGRDPNDDPTVKWLQHVEKTHSENTGKGQAGQRGATNARDDIYFSLRDQGMAPEEAGRRAYGVTRDPTAQSGDEFKYSLYKRDPQAFKNIYGDKGGQQDMMGMLRDRQLVQNQMKDEINPAVHKALQDQLDNLDREIIARRQGTSAQATPNPAVAPPTAPSTKQAPAAAPGKTLDPNNPTDKVKILDYLRKGGGDPRKAWELAKKDGYTNTKNAAAK